MQRMLKLGQMKRVCRIWLYFMKKAAKYLSGAVGEIYGVPVLSFFKEGKIDEKFIGLTPYGVLENEIKKLKFNFAINQDYN